MALNNQDGQGARVGQLLRQWGTTIGAALLALGLVVTAAFTNLNFINLNLGVHKSIQKNEVDEIILGLCLIFIGLGIDRWLSVRREGMRSAVTRAEIAERQEANEKLKAALAMTEEQARRQESDEQFRQLADNIREVFFSLTPDPPKMTYISPAYDIIWGRPREELYQNPQAWMESMHPDDREAVGIFYGESSAGAQLEKEYRVVRPDGSIRWIDARTFPVRDEHGKFIRVVGIAEDITERREAHQKLEAALRAAESQAREAAKLTELLDILQSCQTTDEAYKIIGDSLPHTLAAGEGALCITSSSRNIVEAMAVWGETLATEKTFRPDDCWGLRRGKVHTVGDPASSLRCAHVRLPAAGYVCVPLAAQGETLGVLYVECQVATSSSEQKSGQNELEELSRRAVAAGERISLALANLRLREVLRGQSLRDPLTGLFNRRYMEETLEREVQRATRNKQSVALLMIDIDHFKKFNDTFGHQAGDALLRALGDFLIKRTRGQDAACRYGGEEFAIILSGAPIEAAEKRAQLLRKDIKNLAVEYGGQLLGSVTLSIGVAAYPEHATTEKLVRAADKALYRAKTEGRDRALVG